VKTRSRSVGITGWQRGADTEASETPTLVSILPELSMSNPIIAGVDPQHQDDSPLRLAAGLARVTGAPLLAIASRAGDTTRASRMLETDPRADSAAKLEALAAGFEAEAALLEGPSPARVLHDAAVARDASMIVVGSTRRARLAPGSTGERLLHGAPCPVAIAPAALPAGWAPRRIAVGFIDADEGRSALRYGAALAGAASAPLHALTAVEPVDLSQLPDIAPDTSGKGLENAQAAAQRALYLATESLPGGVPASREVVVAHAADALIELSRDADLLICGSRGYGPVQSVLLGSVTRRLTRSADCPVIIVPRDVEQVVASLDGQHEVTAP